MAFGGTLAAAYEVVLVAALLVAALLVAALLVAALLVAALLPGAPHGALDAAGEQAQPHLAACRLNMLLN